MKTKLITSLIAFLVTFGFSTVLTKLFVSETQVYQPKSQAYWISKSKEKQTQRKIYSLLRQDIQNGRERFGKLVRTEGDYRPPFTSSSLAAYSKAVNEYADKSASIYDGDLPEEFQLAWRKHMRAWREHANFLNQLRDSDREMTTEEIARRYYKNDAAISATWYATLDIAEEYDAVPPGAYIGAY